MPGEADVADGPAAGWPEREIVANAREVVTNNAQSVSIFREIVADSLHNVANALQIVADAAEFVAYFRAFETTSREVATSSPTGLGGVEEYATLGAYGEPPDAVIVAKLAQYVTDYVADDAAGASFATKKGEGMTSGRVSATWSAVLELLRQAQTP